MQPRALSLSLHQLRGRSISGCDEVEFKNIRYQTQRRGRYASTGDQCRGETEGRKVYRQKKGSSYLYYIAGGNSGWYGWQVCVLTAHNTYTL